MFRALLAHRQEALHKRHLIYLVRVMSMAAPIMVQPTDSTLPFSSLRTLSINIIKSNIIKSINIKNINY
jgi:hypothetical protein